MWFLKKSEPVTEKLSQTVRLAHQSLLAREDLGFKSKERLENAFSESQSHTSFFQNKKKIVVIGMGGSSLGTKALYHSLWPFDREQHLLFLDNVDGFCLDQILDSFKASDLNDVGWLLCSKSGGTIEVLSLYDYSHEFFQKKYSHSILANTVVICGSQASPLSTFCKEHSLPRLNIPIDVGGRFSVFSPVGIFPLLFMGIDLAAVRSGFFRALEDEKMVCDLSTLLLHAIYEKTNSFYCFHYSERLSSWSLWLQQLWSESLSKKVTHTGGNAPMVSTFVSCRGASDQHSVLQQVIEGREKKVVGFIRVKSSEQSRFQISKSLFGKSLLEGRNLGELLAAEVIATELASQQAGLKTFCLETEELNETSMAYLMGLWMMTIGVLGEALEIDAFNQPGVESGKIIARRVLTDSH